MIHKTDARRRGMFELGKWVYVRHEAQWFPAVVVWSDGHARRMCVRLRKRVLPPPLHDFMYISAGSPLLVAA